MNQQTGKFPHSLFWSFVTGFVLMWGGAITMIIPDPLISGWVLGAAIASTVTGIIISIFVYRRAKREMADGL